MTTTTHEMEWTDPEGNHWNVEAKVEYEPGQANVGLSSGWVVYGGELIDPDESYHRVEIIPEDTSYPDGFGGRVQLWDELHEAILRDIEAGERERDRERWNPGKA